MNQRRASIKGITATRNGVKTEIGTRGGDVAVINLNMGLSVLELFCGEQMEDVVTLG